MGCTEAPAWLSEILHEESFLKYHAYYKGIRHNHMSHGIVAIARLCGTKERVERFCDVYNEQMKKYDPNEALTETHEIVSLKSDKLEDYRGKGQAYYVMLKMYEDLYKNKYNGDIIKMIKDVCPPVFDGPLYGAFHGLIHIAYALSGNNDFSILEGITFNDQQYSPMLALNMDNPKRTDTSKFGYGQTSYRDTLRKLRENGDLKEAMDKENAADEQLKKDSHWEFGIGWPLSRYHGDYFLDLADDLKFPEWFDPKKKDVEQLLKLIDWVGDMSTVLFVESDTVNDFFLLHGITASWSAKIVLPLFQYDQALFGLRAQVAAQLAVYMVQGTPELSHKPEEYYKGDVNQEAWDSFIKASLDGKDYETHVYKGIQCLYEFWKERSSKEFDKYYMAGAHIVRDNHYGLPGGGIMFRNDDMTE